MSSAPGSQASMFLSQEYLISTGTGIQAKNTSSASALSSNSVTTNVLACHVLQGVKPCTGTIRLIPESVLPIPCTRKMKKLQVLSTCPDERSVRGSIQEEQKSVVRKRSRERSQAESQEVLESIEHVLDSATICRMQRLLQQSALLKNHVYLLHETQQDPATFIRKVEVLKQYIADVTEVNEIVIQHALGMIEQELIRIDGDLTEIIQVCTAIQQERASSEGMSFTSSLGVGCVAQEGLLDESFSQSETWLLSLCTEVHSYCSVSFPRTFRQSFQNSVCRYLARRSNLKKMSLNDEQQSRLEREFRSLLQKIVIAYVPESREESIALIKDFGLSLGELCDSLQAIASDPEPTVRAKIRFLLQEFPFTLEQQLTLLSSVVELGTDACELLEQWEACAFLSERDRIFLFQRQIEKFHELHLVSPETFLKTPEEQSLILHQRLQSLGIISPSYLFQMKSLYFLTLPSQLSLIAVDRWLNHIEKVYLFQACVMKNAAFVFEHWSVIAEWSDTWIGDPRCKKEQKMLAREMDVLRSHLAPYFLLRQDLELLKEKERVTVEEFRSILSRVHELNRRGPIPLSFYRPCLPNWHVSMPHSLDRLLERIVASCTTGEQLVQLMDCLSENYFVGTNWLFTKLYPKVHDLIPEMEKYFTLHVENPVLPIVSSPFVTAEGALYVLKSKLEKKMDLARAQVDLFEVSALRQKIMTFKASSLTYNFSLLFFRDPKHRENPAAYHYSPIYMEKNQVGEVQIFNSDSLGSGWKFRFAEQIKEVLIGLQEEGVISKSAVVTQRRQQDEYSCVVFAIRDLIEIMNTLKTKNSFFDSLALQEGAGCSLVQEFPPSFLKVLQSISHMHGKEQSEVTHHTQVRLSLGDYVREHMYVAPLLPLETKFYTDLKQRKANIPFLLRNFNAAKRECSWYRKIAKKIMHTPFGIRAPLLPTVRRSDSFLDEDKRTRGSLPFLILDPDPRVAFRLYCALPKKPFSSIQRIAMEKKCVGDLRSMASLDLDEIQEQCMVHACDVPSYTEACTTEEKEPIGQPRGEAAEPLILFQDPELEEFGPPTFL